MFVKNVGRADGLIRRVIGVLAMAAGFYYKSWWGALGVLPVLTAIVSWCPAYAPLKISTVPEKEKK